MLQEKKLQNANSKSTFKTQKVIAEKENPKVNKNKMHLNERQLQHLINE
jgi:hypothetical protein